MAMAIVDEQLLDILVCSVTKSLYLNETHEASFVKSLSYQKMVFQLLPEL